MTAMLEARGLAKAFGTGSSEIRVLTDCSISVQRGERVAVLGHSGVGKSTMLHLLAGLDRPDAGSILFDGSDVSRLSETEQAQMRNRRVGMVFQFYHLLPEFSAHENVMMPMLIARAAEGASDRAHQLLEEVGLSDRAGHFPSELSGGERQRVAIARALARAPDVLLADEPTGNLDHDNGIRVMELFDQLYESHRMAIVMVTHNPDLTGSFDRVLTMAAGGFLSAYDRDGT